MDFDTSMRVSGSGLSATRTWLNVVSSNLANMNTTKTASGNPYERQTVLYRSAPLSEGFDAALAEGASPDIEHVESVLVVPDGRPFREVHDPGHPDADERGIVRMPAVSAVEEMANLMAATRAYEANLSALSTAKQLALKALEIGRQ